MALATVRIGKTEISISDITKENPLVIVTTYDLSSDLALPPN